MNNIPEGTQFIESGCGTKGFRKYEKGQWLFFDGFWRVVDWKMGDLNPVSSHPYYAAPIESWDGEGMPPAGTECEHQVFGCSGWTKATVLAYGAKKTFYRDEHGNEWSRLSDEIKFRPIRTPEQIAAEERSDEVRKMMALNPDENPNQVLAKWLCEALYDAGYRKQEAS